MSHAEAFRVLHCIGSLNRGGAQRQLQLLVRNCSPERFRHDVLCVERDVYGNGGEGVMGFEEAREVIEIGRAAWPRLAGDIYREVVRRRPDVVHVWLPEKVMIPAALAALRLRCPLVSSQRRSMLTWRDRLKYVPHLAADRLVANFHQRGEPLLLRWLFARKGLVIPNGIDLATIPAQPGESLGIDRPGRRLLYVGRVASHKRIDVAIRAVGRLRERGLQVGLAVVGGGAQEALQDLGALAAELGVSQDIHFLGYREPWTRYARDAELLVLPSESEGMSNVLLEAAASGLPVVAPDLPEVRAVFTHGRDARLVRPGSSRALATEIEDLLASPETRREMALAGRALARRYSVEAMAAAYGDLYDELLAPPAARRRRGARHEERRR